MLLLDSIFSGYFDLNAHLCDLEFLIDLSYSLGLAAEVEVSMYD